MNFMAMRNLRYHVARTVRLLALLLLPVLGVSGVCSAQATGPCDIFAAASPATPCVAAFSTTRVLYGGYTGSLYQVTRASDGMATDVGVLPDGYANASIQDAFCSASTCTITKIYDQTSNHNDLTKGPAGYNGGADVPASATSLPLVVGGHKVYGIFISAGLGYRNDSTQGIAVHGQAEGVYMVSSALALPPSTNGHCCFDFGNAEITNNDDGYGTMDAMNLIVTANGPAASLDVENGLIGFLPVTAGTQFVTAMAWNNGSNFNIYEGNSQSGTLTPKGSTKLGTNYYGNMKQEGAIILGIGGDNSNYAPGHFFEGVMTFGAPTDASMNAVQANIVAAGYQGAPVTLVDGGTYTFQNQQSQYALDNDCDGCSGGATTGVAVVQNAMTGLTPQQWTLAAKANGYFTVTSKQSGLCLDDPFGNGVPSRQLPQSSGTSTMLWQQTCNGLPTQNWLFVPQSDSSFVIVNQGATTNQGGSAMTGTAMVVDVLNGEATQGLQMWLTTANALSPQNWLATSVTGTPSGTISDGATYTLQNEASLLLLGNNCDGCTGAPTNGVSVIQNTANGLARQEWTLHSKGGGYFTMVSNQSGFCLDDPWGNGTPSRQLPQVQGTSTMLWQQPCNNATAQNWQFLPQSDGSFVVKNEAATANNNNTPMVLDDYNGQSTQGLQMWLTTANGLPPQNWRLSIQ